jgi:hypothetical protein
LAGLNSLTLEKPRRPEGVSGGPHHSHREHPYGVAGDMVRPLQPSGFVLRQAEGPVFCMLPSPDVIYTPYMNLATRDG